MPYASAIRKTANVVSPTKHACTVDHVTLYRNAHGGGPPHDVPGGIRVVGLVGNLLPTVAADVLPQGGVPIELAGRVLELDDESRGPKRGRLTDVCVRRLVPERRIWEVGGWYAGHVVDQDSGVPLLEGRGAVGGQETDGLVVGVSGRLIAG